VELGVGTGFYGKVPALGDFVSRRVGPAFLEVWDLWLQRGIHRGREALGDSWTGAYMESPVWRFALPAGCCGDRACGGVFLPSVDRVGRQFPFTLVAFFPEAPVPASIMAGTGEWFDHAEDLAVSVLGSDFDLDAFDGDTRRLVPDLTDPRAAVQPPRDDVRWLLPLPFDEALEREIPAWLGPDGVSELDRLALWWTSGSDRVEPCLLVSDGLPGDDGFTGMIAGDENGRYWQRMDVRREQAGSPTRAEEQGP
jgi:type VI secretion system protein ImpM